MTPNERTKYFAKSVSKQEIVNVRARPLWTSGASPALTATQSPSSRAPQFPSMRSTAARSSERREQLQLTYTYFVERGNNSRIVKRVLAKRPWLVPSVSSQK